MIASSVTAALLLALGAERSSRHEPATGTPPFGAPCFGVEGAVREPGLRCAPSPSAGSLGLLPPCDAPEPRDRIDRLVRECPLQGRRLILAPDRPGGPCRPRLADLPGPARRALGLPLDLRTASAADLEALPGVGPRLAARIRAARGTFESVEDLARVPGFGRARLEALRGRVTLGPPAGEAGKCR